MRARARPVLLAVLCLLPWTTHARGDDAADRALVQDVAAEVAAVHEAGGGETLRILAQRRSADPWRVVDRLCEQGLFDAAVAYAQADPRPAVLLLPTYADRRRESPTPTAWREALDDAQRLIEERAYGKAVTRLDGLVDQGALAERRAPEEEVVTAVDILANQGRALLGDGLVGGILSIVCAAHVAERMGWRSEARRLADETTLAVRESAAENDETITWQTARSQAIGLEVGLGRYEEALPLLQARFAELEGTENWLFLFDAGLSLGRCLRATGRLAEAEHAVAAAHRAAETFAFDSLIGTAQAEQASLAEQRGDARRAIRLREEAAAHLHAAGVPAHEELMHFSNALLWRRLAAYPRAFEAFDRCAAIAAETNDKARRAEILSQVATTYRMLGSYEKAGEHLQRALALVGELGHPDFVAGIYQNLGSLRLSAGRPENALPAFERARALYALAENPGGVAAACANLGLAHAEQGAAEEAMRWRALALRTIDAAGLLEARPGILVGNGEIESLHGRLEAGLLHLVEAARDGEALERPDVVLKAHRARARILYRHLRYEEALAAAREALRWMPRVLGGLGEEESVGVRALHASVFDVGMLCALTLHRPRDLLLFLEAGRAGALLESLGGRSLLGRAAIPPEFAHEESEARALVARARQRYREAVKNELLSGIRDSKRALGEATARLEGVVERVQRTKKARTGLVYPVPGTAETIRASLGTHDALVLYAILPGRAVAILLTRGAARVVDLGPAKPIVDRCASFDAFGRESEIAECTTDLRARLIVPLRLPANVETLIVSPSDLLTRVPFALLVPSIDVAYAPSGTTWTVLAEQTPKRGAGVLAVGDPAYEDPSLPRLPETRREAAAVGTTVLVGEDATETCVLEAAAQAERWRALHFACHGIVDAKRPLRSALALTPDENDDGRFTVLDVMRQDLPAEIAVLSACDTGRGQVVRAEGIVGLTRAFMAAGSPRVLCSLWKVDDAATRALMQRFYELWNPPAKPGDPEQGPAGHVEGSAGEGLSPAKALRLAQAHVRAREGWAHPRYWAAWVLWGPPR